ncbi:MAG: phosphoribosylglycinamide formyltransferase [Bacteroidota bacterium]|jgi:phosphoribosylglycinamide formyltransferase-1
MYKIAVFASGTGSNAAELIRFFNEKNEDVKSVNNTENRSRNNTYSEVTLVVSNRHNAGVLLQASAANIPIWIVDKALWNTPAKVVSFLQKNGIDFIILAGFLWKIPLELCAAFPNKITNIHPSLLPKYGGKGMYGSRVHQAVLEACETESGITIHYVNENYDEGSIIQQIACPVLAADTVESLAKRIQTIELATYKVVINDILTNI